MSDEIVWQIINQQFCAFKLKTTKGNNFCRNEYNVSGFCNRQSCPLANSRYATVRTSPKGTIYLYIKTIERAHMPSKWWEKIKLSQNYAEALQQIEDRLQYFPKFLLHKCKQRLTRLVQVATRMRKLAAEEDRLGEKLVPKMAPKVKHREEARERKALIAAKLERTIERELLERLRQGMYGDQPLNVSESVWKKVLHGLEKEGEGTRDKDLDEGIEDEDEDEEEEEELEEEIEDGNVEYVSDFEETDDELNDIEDWLGSDDEDDAEDDDDEDDDEGEGEGDSEEDTKKKTKAGDKRKRGKVTKMKARKKKEIEVEHETDREKLLAF